MKTEALKYRVFIEWSEDDGVYVARVPAFPGCTADGTTIEKAAKEIYIVLSSVIEDMKEDGDPLPESDTCSHSGKTVLRMPPFLHAEAARRSESEGVSLNQLLVTLIARGLGQASSTIAPSPTRLSSRSGRSRSKSRSR